MLEETRSSVSVVVEPTDDKKFRIATTDLQTIASQLRSKSKFSVFNSVIIPIGVTILTALATTAIGQVFQYISWKNSTNLQAAEDRTKRATAAYTRASSEIQERLYATIVFVPAVRDLINRKEPLELALYNLESSLIKNRFVAYNDQIKKWNVSYEQILGEIDFGLDRPVKIHETTHQAIIQRVDCSKSLPEQMKLVGLNANSLKLQFATIKYCFANAKALLAFNDAREKAVTDKSFIMDQSLADAAEDSLSAINSMSNIFRCYALSRIELLKDQEEPSIYVPPFFDLGIGRPEFIEEHFAKVTEEHFAKVTSSCHF